MSSRGRLGPAVSGTVRRWWPPSRGGARRILGGGLMLSLLLAAACTTSPASTPVDAADQPSPFADCAALTLPPEAAAGAPSSPGPSSPEPSAPATGPSGGGATGGTGLAAAELPAVTLPCFTGGEPVRLTDLRGPAVLNLWGTWCEPCRKELPAVQRLADRTVGRLHVVGVDTRDSREAAGSFGTDLRITIPNLYDREETLRNAVGVFNLPSTIFIDAAGRQYTYQGLPLADATLDALVAEHTGVKP